MTFLETCFVALSLWELNLQYVLAEMAAAPIVDYEEF